MTFTLHHCSAIITGASSGLGAEFARQLAPQARSLHLVSRRLDALEKIRAEVLAINPALQVHLTAADLATDEGRGLLLSEVTTVGLLPDLLINNAGLGDYGTVASAEPEKLRLLIDLNITALVLLTQAMISKLRQSPGRPAGILNVSSLASTLPLPDMAVYAASKAFVSSFSEALAVELAPANVVVSCVCPGPTPTNFGNVAQRENGVDIDRNGQDLLKIPPQQVVATALQTLASGHPLVYPGTMVSIMARVFRLMPRFLLRWQLRRRFASQA